MFELLPFFGVLLFFTDFGVGCVAIRSPRIDSLSSF